MSPHPRMFLCLELRIPGPWDGEAFPVKMKRVVKVCCRLPVRRMWPPEPTTPESPADVEELMARSVASVISEFVTRAPDFWLDFARGLLKQAKEERAKEDADAGSA